MRAANIPVADWGACERATLEHGGICETRPAKSSGMRMAFCEIGDARASPLRFDGGLSEYSALFRKVVKFHDMTC
ncbi:hypothetical protein EXY72_28085 [Burkholderia pseudomallei]|nr:hypothetical protein EXY28_28040 [Burkholderia pseudomallei]QBI50140.1 hypothetical protein EXY72_28085 [Burkholderia pseudomallei]